MVTPSVKSWNNIPNDAGFLYGIRDFIPTQGKGPVRWLLPEIRFSLPTIILSELVSMDLNGKNLKKQVLGAPLAFHESRKG